MFNQQAAFWTSGQVISELSELSDVLLAEAVAGAGASQL